MSQCTATTQKGNQCKRRAIKDEAFCSIHSKSFSKEQSYFHRVLVGNDESVKNIISSIQSLFTIAAILIGGIWFIFSDQGSRKVNVSHSVSTYVISDKWRWVGTKIRVENAGNIAIKIEDGTVWLQKILPVPVSVQDLIDNDKALIPDGEREVQWGVIGDIRKDSLSVTILPGEVDELEYDFIVPTTTKVVKLYSHFSKSNNPDIGWQHTSVIDLQDVLIKTKTEKSNDHPP